MDGDAFVRTTDSKAITGFAFTNNRVSKAGTYGLFLNGKSRGAGFAAAFPGGQITNNVFTNAHATFKAAFPFNTWEAL